MVLVAVALATAAASTAVVVAQRVAVYIRTAVFLPVL